MYVNSEQALDSIFLSYDKILKKLHQLGLTTKQGKEITELDLRKAIDVMLEKHPTCRWRSEKIKSRKYFILIEGYYWLLNVYFQKEKSLIDADIDFFEDRIKQYEELLKVENNQNWWKENMDIKQLCKYFDRKETTIRKAIKQMCDNGFGQYKFLINNKGVISSKGVKWLCKNVFKKKYLELLEKYKMELTELYIEKGYIYDEFFGKN
ncbi:hypothetical protein [uncultured Subdoligranulum sp.]|uniref:hypothetical protein n=1 Tax=uncultured Subdoligranulum sp. TaxID=512298 RepID=UPI0025D4701F|nr:hypothetical protein [uncultured Subdoligranulum sp.]